MKMTPGVWHSKIETDYVPAQVWADGRLLADVYGESREARAANAAAMASAPILIAAAWQAIEKINQGDARAAVALLAAAIPRVDGVPIGGAA